VPPPQPSGEYEVELLRIEGTKADLASFSTVIARASAGAVRLQDGRLVAADRRTVISQWESEFRQLENLRLQLDPDCRTDELDLAFAQEQTKKVVVELGKSFSIYLREFKDALPQYQAKQNYPLCEGVIQIDRNSEKVVIGQCTSCDVLSVPITNCISSVVQTIDLDDIEFIIKLLEDAVGAAWEGGGYCAGNRVHEELLHSIQRYVIAHSLVHMVVHEIDENAQRRTLTYKYPSTTAYEASHVRAEALAGRVSGVRVFRSGEGEDPCGKERLPSGASRLVLRFAGGLAQWKVTLVQKNGRFLPQSTAEADLEAFFRRVRPPGCAACER
jgi:hypothetical protein